MKSASDRGRINSDEFVTMFQEMATRPEIYFLLIRFANRDYFTTDDFRHFLECEQGVRLYLSFSFFLFFLLTSFMTHFWCSYWPRPFLSFFVIAAAISACQSATLIRLQIQCRTCPAL